MGMYVYQVSEKDSGKITKNYIIIKFEEFYRENRIHFSFHTSRHWEYKSNVKSVSFRRQGAELVIAFPTVCQALNTLNLKPHCLCEKKTRGRARTVSLVGIGWLWWWCWQETTPGVSGPILLRWASRHEHHPWLQCDPGKYNPSPLVSQTAKGEKHSWNGFLEKAVSE